MSTELQVMENTIDADVLADLTVRREPSIVLEEARRAAVCLKDVLDKKPQKVMMNDEQYLEFEDWQTVGKFYGVTCGTDADPNPDHAPTVEFVRFGEIEGFKATCVALHNGKVISRATAFCMKDEEKWGERNKYAWAYCLKSGGTSVEDPPKHEIMWIPNPNKEGKFLPKKEKILVGKESVPLYQLASMAQTRANSKVLRNVLSWVVVLAGYKPTPAEEILEAKHVPQQTEPLPTGAEMLAKKEAKGSVLEPPMKKDMERPLTNDDLANAYDQFHGGRRARTLPIDTVMEWAETQPHLFFVDADGNFFICPPQSVKGSVLEPTTAEVLKEMRTAQDGEPQSVTPPGRTVATATLLHTSQDAVEEPPLSVYFFVERLELAQSVKEWSDTMNKALRYEWGDEDRATLKARGDQAMKQLKDAEKGKKK